jgi:malate dehydrogenase (oxaloacetate-decarboxylating)(NADP+)
LAKEDIPDSVLNAYGLEALKFGDDCIIPKPLDPRVLLWVAPAVAEAAIESGVARKQIDLDVYREQLAMRQGKGQQVRFYFMNRAKAVRSKKRIVFAEGEETKIIRAAAQVQEEGIAIPILLGRSEIICPKIEELGLKCELEIIDPRDNVNHERYKQAYYELRRRKGISLRNAEKQVRRRTVYAPLMVQMGDADAVVSGLTYDYPEVIRPALQIHHTQAEVKRAAGVYIVIVDERVYLFADTTVNIEPSAEDLAEIAILAAKFAEQLGLEPRVALLSFSNFGSTPHPLSDKIKRAVALIHEKAPDLCADGEMQADTAVVPELVEQRYPFSQVKDANVLIFPSLESANISYKLVARLGKAHLIGPILLGVGAPVHVLQTGDEVRDIVNIAAVAVLDAESREAN